jgi:hypothetical protein
VLKSVVKLIALASLVAGCAQSGRCLQSGGVWRSALAICDRSAGGGGY